jgi:hypothetical protein
MTFHIEEDLARLTVSERVAAAERSRRASYAAGSPSGRSRRRHRHSLLHWHRGQRVVGAHS